MGTMSGSLTLGQVATRFGHLEVRCAKCGRAGPKSMAVLLAEHGPDIHMPDLAAALAEGCSHKGVLTYDLCQVYFPQLVGFDHHADAIRHLDD